MEEAKGTPGSSSEEEEDILARMCKETWKERRKSTPWNAPHYIYSSMREIGPLGT
jgi:hypothetical protein